MELIFRALRAAPRQRLQSANSTAEIGDEGFGDVVKKRNTWYGAGFETGLVLLGGSREGSANREGA